MVGIARKVWLILREEQPFALKLNWPTTWGWEQLRVGRSIHSFTEQGMSKAVNVCGVRDAGGGGGEGEARLRTESDWDRLEQRSFRSS